MIRKFWTAEEAARLTAEYPNKSNAALAIMFACAENSIADKAYQLHLRKDPDYKRVCNVKRLGARYHGESLAEKLLAGVRAAGDTGLTRAAAEDTYGNNPASVRTNLSKLVKAGTIFAAGWWDRRIYFISAERAQAVEAETREANRLRVKALRRIREDRRRKAIAEGRITVPKRERKKTMKPKKNTRPGRCHWTEAELDALRAGYPTQGVASVPHRSRHAVTRMAAKMGIACVVKNLSHGKAKPKTPKAVKPPKPPKPKAVLVKREWHGQAQVAVKAAPGSPQKRGPAYLDIPVTYSPNFRHVVGPSPRLDRYRTNTHSEV